MKFQAYCIIALISVLSFSCTDDMTDVGTKIQPAGETIFVDAKSFPISTENYKVPFMYSRPDSLLLGSFTDNILHTGTTYADIFAQVQPPVDFSFPEGSVADSIKLVLYYYSWFGDKYSPMQVNIYEMNKGNIFDFTKAYTSVLDPNDYVDPNNKILIGSRIFTASDADVSRPDSTALEFPLSANFLDRFSTNMLTTRFSSNPFDLTNSVSKFHELFNGVHVSTDFGSASMLYIRSLNIRFYFHYDYVAPGETETTRVDTYVNYPANKEVRQINRFEHPNRDEVIAHFNAQPEVNLISSPANIYTKLNIPLQTIKDSLNVDNKKLLINAASLRVDAVNVKDTSLAQPLVSTMLLIKESAYQRFFSRREMPSDTCAIIANVARERSAAGNEFLYYYKFNLAKLISTQLRDNPDLSDDFKMILVPVSVQFDSNNQVVQVKEQNVMSTTIIGSQDHPTRGMKLKMVYSGF